MLWELLGSAALSTAGSLGGAAMSGGSSAYQPQRWQIGTAFLPFVGAGIQQYQADQTNAATRKFVGDMTGFWGGVGGSLANYYNQTGAAGGNFLNQMWSGGQADILGGMNTLLYGAPFQGGAMPDINALAKSMAVPDANGNTPSQADIVTQLQPIYDAYAKQTSAQSGLPRALQGYAGRYESLMGQLEGMGTQSRKDINQQYDEERARQQSNLAARGLSGSTIGGAAYNAVERERSGALGRLDESLRSNQMTWGSLLSGDFLNAQGTSLANLANFNQNMGSNAMNWFGSGIGQRVGSYMDVVGNVANLQNLLVPQGPAPPNWGDVFGSVSNNLSALTPYGGGGTINPYSAAVSGSANQFANAFLLNSLFGGGGGGVNPGTAATAGNMAANSMSGFRWFGM